MTSPPTRIRPIAICIVRRGDEILVSEGIDPGDGHRFFRPLGGGIEPGERAIDAVAREMREELNSGLLNLRQRGLIENLFEVDGHAGHEHVFVFEADLDDPSLYASDVIDAAQDNGEPMRAVWRQVDAFDEANRLVPSALRAFLDPAYEPSYGRREFSAKINLWLELPSGQRLSIAQASSDFIILREPHTCGPCDATLVVSVDGKVDRQPVHLPAGLDHTRIQQPIVDRTSFFA